MKPKQTKGGCIVLVEKMKLIHVQGTLPHLDEFLGRCCLDGRVNLEPASQYMSASLGYGPLNEEDPYTPLVARIEPQAQQLGAQHPGTPARPRLAGPGVRPQYQAVPGQSDEPGAC